MVRTTDASEKYRAPDSGNWVDGVPHPPFIRQKPWSELRRDWADHMHRPGDVWVTTFPKCGTTFMEQIVLLLLNGGEGMPPTAGSNANLDQQAPGTPLD